jgi:hypothetical protein
MAESRYRTFHYKSARLSGLASAQELLEQAMRAEVQIGERKEYVERTAQTRFITLTHPVGGLVCGTAVVYTEGNHQAMVAVDDTLHEVSVHQIAPPEDGKGRRNEFVEGTLFFGLRGNHVILVQSASFKALQFEEHLNWLLRKARLAKFGPVAIFDVPPAALGAAGWRGVRSITLRTPITAALELPFRELPNAGTHGGSGKGWDILCRVLEVLDAASSEGFCLDQLLPGPDVELVFQVRHKGRGPKGNRTLDELAALFSHLEDEAVAIEIDVPTLGRVGREQLQIKQSFRVPADGGLPDANAVFAKMQDWLETLLKTDMIRP